MPSFEYRFMEGIAVLLAAQTSATWRDPAAPAAVYQPGETAIAITKGLPQVPDAAVALATYGVADDPSLSDSVIGLQVTTRAANADPRDDLQLAEEIFDALHGLHDVTLSTGVRLVQCLRRSHTSIGQDQNDRWRRVQNFYVDVHRPSPNRT